VNHDSDTCDMWSLNLLLPVKNVLATTTESRSVWTDHVNLERTC